MVLIETNFPRGGTVQHSSGSSKLQENENIVFGARQEKKKSKKKLKRKHETEEKEITNIFETAKLSHTVEAISAELISYKTIQEGMLIMGTIKSIDLISLKISLPGRMIGKILASSISESYNKILKKFVQSNIKLDNFKQLPDMFKIGQIVYCCVMEIKNDDGKIDLVLSLKPKDKHSHFQHSYLKKGMIFCGAIEEIQEHGFIIENGVKNFRCFLPNENINTEDEFGIGQLVNLKIKNLTKTDEASTAVVKLILDENKNKIKDLLEPNLDYLLPSNIVNFTITKIHKNGLQGTIMNAHFTGYVNEHQLSEPFSTPDEYELNSTVLARILYVMPLTKLVYLSLQLNHHKEQELKRGDIIENAVVHHHGTGGVVFVLNHRLKGLLSFKNIQSNYTTNYDHDEILTKYRKKSKHKLRLIEFDPMDSLYICNDNATILNERYFTLEDCKIGEIVSGTLILKHKQSGCYFIKLGNCCGVIDKLFLGAQSMALQENQKIRCRILATNPERNVVYLTNRQEYLTKNIPILQNLSQARENKIFLGTIVKCFERFFVVKFFNNLKGLLYKTSITGFMSGEFESFREGQVMPFRIMQKTPERLIVELVANSHKVGELCEAKIVHCMENGLEVEIEDDESFRSKGLVPARLVSEFQDLVQLKLKSFHAEQKLEVACIVKTIFSIRDIDYFKSAPIRTFKSIQSGDIIRSFIKNIENDIVELLLPVRGIDKLLRVHLQMFLLNSSSNANLIVYPDQIVYVKVLSKEQITKTLTVSAKLTDVWNGNFEFTANYWSKYFDDLELIRKYLKSIGSPLVEFKLGERVKGKLVLKIKESSSCHVELPNGVQGLIKKSGTMKKSNEGDDIELIIVWIDYQNKIVYCSDKVSDFGKISTGLEMPQNYIGKSNVKAKVLLKLDQIVVCSLKKGKNPLVFLPPKLHYNDFEEHHTKHIIEEEFYRLSFIHNKWPIAILEETKKLWRDLELLKSKLQDEFDTVQKNRKIQKKFQKIQIRKKQCPLLIDRNSDLSESSDCEDYELFDKDTKNKTIKKTKHDDDVQNPFEILRCGSENPLKKLEKINQNKRNNSPTLSLNSELIVKQNLKNKKLKITEIENPFEILEQNGESNLKSNDNNSLSKFEILRVNKNYGSEGIIDNPFERLDKQKLKILNSLKKNESLKKDLFSNKGEQNPFEKLIENRREKQNVSGKLNDNPFETICGMKPTFKGVESTEVLSLCNPFEKLVKNQGELKEVSVNLNDNPFENICGMKTKCKDIEIKDTEDHQVSAEMPDICNPFEKLVKNQKEMKLISDNLNENPFENICEINRKYGDIEIAKTKELPIKNLYFTKNNNSQSETKNEDSFDDSDYDPEKITTVIESDNEENEKFFLKEYQKFRIAAAYEDKKTKTQSNPVLPGPNDFWSSNNTNTKELSSENEDIEEEQPLKKKKRLTVSERFKIEKAEETRLRGIEEKLANPDIKPESADQFDRLVLSDPNNSKNWINYMVFYLQSTEIDKARNVVSRALKSISFREEEDIINVWMALLNLELRYGTKDSYEQNLKECLLCNDQLKIYFRVMEILSDSHKLSELTELINTVTKKFKNVADVWKKSANSYFKAGLNDKARQLLNKALAVLPDREHISVIVAFANFHNKFNDNETAHTLMEQIITSYPKRVDIWSQYIDMLVKNKQIESARTTLERAVIQKIPIKKMKTLFKKYLEFEEKFGNENNVQKVKQMAENYVKKEVEL